MRGRMAMLGSLLIHGALAFGVAMLAPSSTARQAFVAFDLEARRPPPPPPPPAPKPPPPPVVEEHAPSPAPIAHAKPRARRPAAAAGPRVVDPPPTAEAAPLPPPEPTETDESVELPAAEGTGAGGVASAGNGDPAGGSGDGQGAGDGGRPPIPLEAARHARLPYTRAAIDAHAGGVVLVKVLVDENGNVADARLVQTIGYGLDPIALVTARRFHFLPARDGAGRPVRQWITWRFHFEPAD